MMEAAEHQRNSFAGGALVVLFWVLLLPIENNSIQSGSVTARCSSWLTTLLTDWLTENGEPNTGLRNRNELIPRRRKDWMNGFSHGLTHLEEITSITEKKHWLELDFLEVWLFRSGLKSTMRCWVGLYARLLWWANWRFWFGEIGQSMETHGCLFGIT